MYTAPDKTVWKTYRDEINPNKSKGVLIYQHVPITDSKGRTIEPVIAFIYERQNSIVDPVKYAEAALAKKQFNPKYTRQGGYPQYSSDKHSAVYAGEYTRDGIKHKVVLGYICCNSIGIEIVCDATDEVFKNVEADMTAFLRSVKVRD